MEEEIRILKENLKFADLKIENVMKMCNSNHKWIDSILNENKELKDKLTKAINNLKTEREISQETISKLRLELKFHQLKLQTSIDEARKLVIEKEKQRTILKEIDLDCPVCMNDWNVNVIPRVLNCGHMVCGNCLRDIHDCPICRTKIVHASDTCIEYIKLLSYLKKINSK